MCGIAGRVNFLSGAPVQPSMLARMCELMSHRGPDGDGTFCSDGMGFAHRRLSVIDLRPLGRQPMVTSDGQIAITFNGEIYNFQELRADLEGRGHRFTSRTDTEVILAAYREFGTGCVDRLAGMFAFAIWDGPRRRLLLARDRLGKKPLFYRRDREGIAFASEPKSFLAEPGFSAEVDLPAISHYLSFQYVPAPWSAFRGVEKLPPAHTLVVEDGRVTVARYWRLAYAPKRQLAHADALEALAASLRDAVKTRLVGDVPIGAFLSGGIDSGLVVSFMAECLNAPVRTFSIGFTEEEYQELPAARRVADRYETDHREFVVQPDATALLPQLVWHYGEPFGDSSALPTFVLAELTRRHVTVALNGDGGDESFAGYDRYRGSVQADRVARIPFAARRAAAAAARMAGGLVTHPGVRRLRRLCERAAEPPERRYAAWMMHFDRERKGQLCTPEFLAAAPDGSTDLIEAAFASSGATTLLDRMLDVDVRMYLPDDLLVKVDIATMAHGLEARSPFLDHRLMEFAASLDPAYKLRGTVQKHLLRALAADRLPARNLTLPKKGFGVPIDYWFRGELRAFAHDVLLGSRARSRGYFRAAYIEQMLDEHVAGRARWHYQLWTLLMFELWHRMFIDVRPSAPPERLAVTEVESAAAGARDNP